MHLLNTTTYERVEAADLAEMPQYAILSHRWVGKEITYKTHNPTELAKSVSPSPQHDKIKKACAKAKEQGLEYLWIDTCCIDKSSSAELSTALNSMFKWYQEAKVCYTYLYDVKFTTIGRNIFKSQLDSRKIDNQDSEWFERGWTLQELLAPRHMEIYDQNWTLMGTRKELASHIERVTGISESYLTNAGSKFREANIATKMSWMAGRTTRDIEDIAYSLLGIFNVSMVPLYGEGIEAFTRLQDTLLQAATFDESIFAWTTPPRCELKCYRKYEKRHGSLIASIPIWKQEKSAWGLLAPSPDCFKASNSLAILPGAVPRLGKGFQRTHQGICFDLPLKETKGIWGTDKKDINLVLNCWNDTDERAASAIVLELTRSGRGDWIRVRCDGLGQKKNAKVGDNRRFGVDQTLVSTVTVSQPKLELVYRFL